MGISESVIGWRYAKQLSEEVFGGMEMVEEIVATITPISASLGDAGLSFVKSL
jgi:hypothetical protein